MKAPAGRLLRLVVVAIFAVTLAGCFASVMPTPTTPAIASPTPAASPPPIGSAAPTATATPAAAQIAVGLPGSFVAPSGSDANPGTFEQPWRSLQHAADVAPGAVWLRAGTYAGGVTVSRSGITFQSFPDEQATVSGGADGFTFDQVTSGAVRNLTIENARSTGGAGVMVSRSSNVTIANDVLRNNRNYGVRTVDSTDISIAANDILDNDTGVEVSHMADGVAVVDNQVHDNNRMIVNTPNIPGDDHGAVGITFVKTSGPTWATGNRVWGNRAPSFDYGYDGGAFEVFGSSDVTISDNVAWDNKDVLETGTSGPPCNNLTFTRNVGYAASSISGWSRGLILACASNSLVANNTLDGFDGSDISIVDKPGYKYQGSLAGLRVVNNILRTDGNAVFYFDHLPSTVVIDYNLVWNQSGGSLAYDVGQGDSSSFEDLQSWTGGMAHGVWADPLFVDPDGHDYRLRPESAAVYAGTELGSLTLDLTAPPDIGRWEMGFASR